MLHKETTLQQLDQAYKHAFYFNYFATKQGLLWKLVRLVSSLRFYGVYLLWRLRLLRRKNRKFSLFWGREIRADIVDQDIIILYIFGALIYSPAEYKLSKFFIKHLTPDDVFYDLGANYGFYTYLASDMCREVHAFEPIKEVCDVIKKNTVHNPNVTVSQVAVSNQSGEGELFLSDSSGVSTINKKFADERTDVVHGSYKRSIGISLITLSEYCQSHNIPTCIKMDVEGAEIFVLEGGEDIVKNSNMIISLEVCRFDNGGDASMQAVEKLRSFGYKSYAITDEGDLQMVEGDLSRVLDTAFDNFIFKK